MLVSVNPFIVQIHHWELQGFTQIRSYQTPCSFFTLYCSPEAPSQTSAQTHSFSCSICSVLSFFFHCGCFKVVELILSRLILQFERSFQFNFPGCQFLLNSVQGISCRCFIINSETLSSSLQFSSAGVFYYGLVFSWPVLEASSRGQFVKLLFLRASASVISRAWLALTPDKASSSLRHGISKLWTIQFQMALEFKKETPGAELCNESSHAIFLIDVRRVLSFNARTDCLHALFIGCTY